MRTLLALLLPLPLLAAPPAAPPAEAQAAAAAITPDLLRAHVRFLADDMLEGRGMATRGSALAAHYVAALFESLGLEPAGDDGTFYQHFPVTGLRTHAPASTLFGVQGRRGATLARNQDLVLISGAPAASVKGAEVVFVGYGIVAPEFGWNDYKGVDVKGKVVLVLNGDPDQDPNLFGGRRRLRYGRWDYKFEEAARQGAAAAIIVHSQSSAGYPWSVVVSSFADENYELADGGAAHPPITGWASEGASIQIAAAAGRNLGQIADQAQRRGFQAIPLGITWSAEVTTSRRELKGVNVLAKLPGSDPARAREAVLVTAHYDHLGSRSLPRAGVDAIHHGAVDNATGVAALLGIARAMAALPSHPARSVLFAAVDGEERGLLGSRYLARHSPVAPGRIAVDVNFDALNPFGKTRDAALVGLGKSDVDAVVRPLAEWQGRTLTAEPDPDKGHFYRSDQYAFALAGVPAIYLKGGVDVIGKPSGWGRQQLDTFYAHAYHQPADDLKPSWDFGGMVEDVQLGFLAGLAIANAPSLPQWQPGDEFEAARRNAISEARKAGP